MDFHLALASPTMAEKAMQLLQMILSCGPVLDQIQVRMCEFFSLVNISQCDNFHSCIAVVVVVLVGIVVAIVEPQDTVWITGMIQ